MPGYEVHLADDVGERVILEVDASSIPDALTQATADARDRLETIAARGPVFEL
jgi:hypothetical protein